MIFKESLKLMTRSAMNLPLKLMNKESKLIILEQFKVILSKLLMKKNFLKKSKILSNLKKSFMVLILIALKQ